ncbi:aminopeptidase P family protein [Cohnella endophytica]|uniref:Aminopeptidase P family protein n=1 Tax=Cohnella endophytica TaxID=2419778 RepID=A0A494Y104_9BACL|nr:Xaa-Pro peptidase family protein [Cohnella endophytica]RKP54097.1 aminopeptidase P family protein [Cohnella endophytica]
MTRARISRLRSVVQEKGFDAILISHGPNRRYVSAFTGTSGYVLVSQEEALLMTDFRYLSQATDQAAALTVALHGMEPFESIADYARSLGIRSLGVEAKHLSLSQAHALQAAMADIECVPTEDIVEKLRNVKDEDEVKTLREAARISDVAFAEVLNVIRPGVSERRIAAELEYRMRLLGADCGWPGIIVASGYRSALPHGVASDKEVGRGEFVTLDFGAIVNGYMSDVTRTVFVGEPNERHLSVYAAVLDANEAAIRGLRPGMNGKQGDALGRDIIDSRGFGSYFGHGLGHGIGLEIHEQVRLSKESDSVLEPGNVLTVEPGIYIPGFGGVRIEDDVLITAGGVEVLTSSPKQLIAL